MGVNVKINTPYEIVYDTDGTQSGLVDLRVDYYNPANVHDPLVDFVTLTEVGTTGVYKGSFTPILTGQWTLIASSATSNPPITNKAGRIECVLYDETDLTGVGFSATTDSNTAIRNAVDGISATIAATARGGLLM